MTQTTIRDFTGEIVLPDDATYDGHRSVWNAMVDRRPAMIARCESAADVVAALDSVPPGELHERINAAARVAAEHR